MCASIDIPAGMMSVHKIDVTELLEGATVVCEAHHLSLGLSVVCNATYPLTQASVIATGLVVTSQTWWCSLMTSPPIVQLLVRVLSYRVYCNI